MPPGEPTDTSQWDISRLGLPLGAVIGAVVLIGSLVVGGFAFVKDAFETHNVLMHPEARARFKDMDVHINQKLVTKEDFLYLRKDVLERVVEIKVDITNQNILLQQLVTDMAVFQSSYPVPNRANSRVP